MPIIRVSCCNDCPYLRTAEADWDYKDMPICGKLTRNITSVRIDRRFDKTLLSIPNWCPIKEDI